MDARMIERYADMVVSGHADSDLDSDTRQRVADMLRAVAYAVTNGAVTGTDAAVQQAYMLALTLRHPDYSAFTRAAEVLRGFDVTRCGCV